MFKRLSARAWSSDRRTAHRLEAGLALALTLLALFIRLPHWRAIPPAGDETAQATLAMQVARGQAWPLTGTDAYTGPFFVYFLAGLYRLGAADPLLGRAVMLAAGTLTVPLTYGLARQLGAGRGAGLVAGVLVAVNPHQVLLSSHPGAATFLMPFWVTVFFAAALWAVDGDRPGRWLLAWAAGGLALHCNLVAALPLAGVGGWLALTMRPAARLGWRWPLWPAAGLAAAAVVCAPLLISSVATRLGGAAALEARSYLWDAQPTLAGYASNLLRLSLQLARQTSGRLAGTETLADLDGLTGVFLAWLAAAWVLAPGRWRSLTLAAGLLHLLLVPYLSAHYGLVDPVRFTTYLTPLFSIGMGLAAARLAGRFRPSPARTVAGALGLAGLVLAGPLLSLRQYYAEAERTGRSGAVLEALARQIPAAAAGRDLLIGYSPASLDIPGLPYVPAAYATAAGLGYEFLPADQIIGRLFTTPAGALLWLTPGDVALIEQVGGLRPWPGQANAAARQQGYGLYELAPGQPLVKPDFVLSGPAARAIAPAQMCHVRVGGLELIGYDAPAHVSAGGTLTLRLFWRAAAALPPDTYIGFVHLLTADGAALIAQFDRQLGQYLYPANAWRADEVIVETIALAVPADAPPGGGRLQLGVYTWPSLTRLPIPGHADDVLVLPAVTIGP